MSVENQTGTASTRPEALVFRYVKPDVAADRRKAIRWLGRTDIAYAGVHIIRTGGENTLHSHLHVDGFWTVLQGRVRFYTTNDEVVAELGPMEGIVVPRNFPYWFEAIGDEDLELLQFEVSDEPMVAGVSDRVPLAPEIEDFHATIDKAEVFHRISGS